MGLQSIACIYIHNNYIWVYSTQSIDIELEYSFDRLSKRKIIQVYQLLVPDRIWEIKNKKGFLDQKDGVTKDESDSNLCTGIIGSAKTRAHN